MAGVAEAGAEVTGPRWSLVPDNPAHEAARRAAASDARRRAEAYADALGLTLGPVAWVAEPGLRRPGPGDGYDVPMRSMAMAAAGGRRRRGGDAGRGHDRGGGRGWLPDPL